MKRFLWFCAGADPEILENCPRGEQTRYAGIGSTLVLTAIMASLSGGYALHSSFREIAISIPFGIFWGLLIFNLDRMIVASMRKRSETQVDWKEIAMSSPRIILALLIAVVVAKPLELKLFEKDIVHQLRIDAGKEAEDEKNEIFAFAKALEDSSNKKRQADWEAFTKLRSETPISIGRLVDAFDEQKSKVENLESQNRPRITSIGRQLARVQSSINQLVAKRDSLKQEYSDNQKQIVQMQKFFVSRGSAPISSQAQTFTDDGVEADLDGRRAIMEERNDAVQKELTFVRAQIKKKIRSRTGLQKRSNELKQQLRDEIKVKEALSTRLDSAYTRHERRLHAAQNELDRNRQTLTALVVQSRLETKEKIETVDSLFEDYDGFFTRLHALSNLKEGKLDIRVAGWLIMTLLIVIETAPVLVKLMMPRGPYDRRLQLQEDWDKERMEREVSAIQNRSKSQTAVNKGAWANQPLDGIELIKDPVLRSGKQRAPVNIQSQKNRLYIASTVQNPDPTFKSGQVYRVHVCIANKLPAGYIGESFEYPDNDDDQLFAMIVSNDIDVRESWIQRLIYDPVVQSGVEFIFSPLRTGRIKIDLRILHNDEPLMSLRHGLDVSQDVT